MQTEPMTTAQAIVRFLMAQRIEASDGGARSAAGGTTHHLPLFAGVLAIFGHGNVTCLGEALEPVRDGFPTWRGQNEQSMALAAVGFAKAKRRRQIMVATSSIGPGSTNMVTAAAVAHANRLPVLLLSGDTFAGRIPDPVLQQVEHYHDPSISAADAFRPVTRYWDRIVRPEQVLQSLPHAVGTMLDPATCGPAFLSLPQDVQAEAYDFPSAFFQERVHRIRRQPADADEVAEAARILGAARRPLIVAGGGVRYSEAEEALAALAEAHGIPVTETVAGKGSLVQVHPSNVGPIGVTGGMAANALAGDADVILAVGTRLQDFTTGSWTVFQDPDLRLISINVARWDATKHLAHAVVGDARSALESLDRQLSGYRAERAWLDRSTELRSEWERSIRDAIGNELDPPSYAMVIGAIQDAADPSDYVVSAAGGLPGELNVNWKVREVGTFDCEYGFSCMGYEIAGAWGAKMALGEERDVIAWVGDGSYLMMNSDIYSTVLAGHKVIFLVCDNGGYAVIDRLQVNMGGAHFNNQLEDVRAVAPVRVDFVKHAESMGARAEKVTSLDELKAAYLRAKAADRSSVIVIETDPHVWTGGGAWWDVGVPELSERAEVRAARAAHEAERKLQRPGI
jgi:3D-(3,5/4)-trihydroxycyclohexane-1,2-dione acylhydrolase (decyclizing)